MRFESHDFADAVSLAAAARAEAARGRWRPIGRDGEAPALAFIDRLALARVDWHAAIADAWALLLRDDDAEVVHAAIDALEYGAATPAFADELQGALAAAAAPSRSASSLSPPSSDDSAQAREPRLARVVEAALAQRRRWCGRPALLILRAGATEVVRVAELDDFIALARRAAAHGGSLTGGCAGGVFALDWLRALALYAAWPRALVAPTLAALLQGDAAERDAAVEYAVRAGDKRLVLDAFEAQLRAQRALGAHPITLPLRPAETLAALLPWLAARAAEERASAPVRKVAQA